jgi:hypothetical protein
MMDILMIFFGWENTGNNTHTQRSEATPHEKTYDAGPSEWMTTILFGISATVIWEFKKDSSERNALEKG